MNLKDDNDIADFVEKTQKSIRNNSVNHISKENNMAFLGMIRKRLSSELRINNDKESEGLSAEKVISSVSALIDDIIDENPIDLACQRLGLRYREVVGVSKTFIIPEMDGETVFISGLTENDTDPEIKKEKDTYELIIGSKKLWSKRIMNALDDKGKKFISVDDDKLSLFFHKSMKLRLPEDVVVMESEMDMEQIGSGLEECYDLEKKEDLILMWKGWIEDSYGALQRAGLKEKHGILDFEDFNPDFNSWPDIGGVKLMYYPDCIFNKENGIGNPNGKILNVSGLIKMFRTLGFDVKENDTDADKEIIKAVFTKEDMEKLAVWKKQIEDIRIELEEEAGIIIDGAVMYFCDLNGSSAKSWHKKRFDRLGKKLRSYPSQIFNRDHQMGNHRGEILNEDDLKKMFKMLGFEIADKDQESAMIKKRLLPKWRKQIKDSKISLHKKAGIIEKDGIWYFCNCRGYEYWPNIGGRNLGSFPNCTYNIANSIGNAAGQIKSKAEVRQLFLMLGFVCATDEQEAQMELRLLRKQYPKWRRQILEAKEELEDTAWIIEKDGIWHFSRCRSKNSWPKVGGRNLAYFTNEAFRRMHGIGTEKRQFEHKEEIKALFGILGFKIADDLQELQIRKIMKGKKYQG